MYVVINMQNIILYDYYLFYRLFNHFFQIFNRLFKYYIEYYILFEYITLSQLYFIII